MSKIFIELKISIFFDVQFDNVQKLNQEEISQGQMKNIDA